jgi:hypothetical protein
VEVVMVMTVLTGHECERRVIWGKEGILRREKDKYTACVSRDSKMKPTKLCLKRGREWLKWWSACLANLRP